MTQSIPWQAHYNDIEVPLEFNPEVKMLTDFLDEAASNFGKHTAIIFQNYKLNYKQLKVQAEILAASLREHGVGNGDRVAIMLPNLPQTVITFWGVLKAGAVAVMTNPLYMEKELTHHFLDSGAKVVITMDLFWSKLEPLIDQLGITTSFVTKAADGLSFPLSVLQPLVAKRQGNAPEVKFNSHNVFPWKSLLKGKKTYSTDQKDPHNTLALLQYTGGTTGLSKAAMLSHANIAIQMLQLQSILRGDAKSVDYKCLAVMPYFHVYGLVGCMLLPCLYATSTMPMPRYVPYDLLKIIKKHRPYFFPGAPSIYMSLMQQKNIEKYDLTCIKLCISGSSPFPVESLRKFQKMTGANITEGFGMTECAPVPIANPIYGKQKDGSIGVPLPGTYARIVDLETGELDMPDNEIGELIVKGPQVMSGYWHRPEENVQTLRDGWLYTGDIAYKDEDGYYFIVDRKKDMAIVGGYNVYPREIDEVLYEHPKVQDAVSLSIPHRSRGEVLKAYIVPKEGEKISIPELVNFCKQKLAAYKIPKMFEFREELPKSMVGKVLRRALREEEENKLNEEKNKDNKNN